MKLKDEEAEELKQKNKTIKLKEELNLLKEEHCKEKCRLDEEIGELLELNLSQLLQISN